MPRFIRAARNTSIAGFVIQSWDGVGTPKMTYANIPIYWGYKKDLHGVILPFSKSVPAAAPLSPRRCISSAWAKAAFAVCNSKPLGATPPKLLEDEITYRGHLSGMSA